MQVWRIAKNIYAEDLSGTGAARFGQRWNRCGDFALYAGLTPAICVLETFVHLGDTLPDDYVIVELSLPDDPELYFQPTRDSLPLSWSSESATEETQAYGSSFLNAGRYLGLIVPSALLPESLNLVINPRHPAARQIQLSSLRAYQFDSRMLK